MQTSVLILSVGLIKQCVKYNSYKRNETFYSECQGNYKIHLYNVIKFILNE